MFKFLIFIFLFQLVHWSVVSGTEPTAFGTDRDDIETALKAGVSTDPTAPSGSCASETEAYDRIAACMAPLNTLSTINWPLPRATEFPVKATAANYYLIQSLLEKDEDFTADVLNGVCAGIQKTTDCIATSIAGGGPCNGIANDGAAAAIANYEAQYKLYYSKGTFCSAATKKAAFTDPFADAANKYAACKLTPSGILMEAAFIEAVNHILGLPVVAAIADMKAFIKAGEGATDAEKTLKLKGMCYNVQAAYNKVFSVYFQEKDKFTTDCDDTTLKLWFNLIKTVIPPGVEKACTLSDPTATLPTTAPNPQGTPRKEVAILSYQHIKYHRRATADADKFVSCLDSFLTDPDRLLFEYGNVKIQGDYDSTDNPNLFLKSVKVTIATSTYTAPANTDATLPAATRIETATVVVDGLKATITHKTSGLLIIINKVVSTATPPKGIYGVTLSGSQSVMDLSSGGSMYSGCTLAVNTADTGLNAGTLAAIKTYDNGKQAGSGALSDAVEAAIVASTSTTASPTAASDSCFIKASLSSILFAAAIVKIFKM